jgi:glycosyltransferase involved in cell wall biosynthesis
VSAKRVLISTIAARSGGVPVMVSFAVETLRSLGLEPVIAYYEPYSMSPKLSVPTFALGRRRPGAMRAEPMFGCETHAFGAWLPELEFTTYGLTPQWHSVIAGCEHHIAVSGNVLAARPLVMAGKWPLAWIATDWHGDRMDRVRAFGSARRALDWGVVDPLTSRIERKLLSGVKPLALSQHTAQRIEALSGRVGVPVCPTPIDVDRFVPDASRVVAATLVFSGRLDDPRKNVRLFIDSVCELRRRGHAVRGLLIGSAPSAESMQLIRTRGLDGTIEALNFLPREELARRLQSADVFILPSYQEGLCIAALEAMACGVPVVTTRCGGPEEFVLPGETGAVVDFSVNQLANAVAAIVMDRTLRGRMANNARNLVVTRYTHAHAHVHLVNALTSASPTLG